MMSRSFRHGIGKDKNLGTTSRLLRFIWKFSWYCAAVVLLCALVELNLLQSRSMNLVDVSVTGWRRERMQSKTSACSKVGSSSPNLLLSVPFYVYEEFAWINATVQDKPVADMARRHGQYGNRFKHGGDYWMLEASLKHPMRTRNKTEAKLFFVPWLLNFFDFRSYNDVPMCWKGKCNMNLLRHAVSSLKESETFRKYPDRHVVVRSFYSAHWKSWNQEMARNNKEAFQVFLEIFQQMQVITYEGKDLFPNPGRRFTFPSYHVGTPCALSAEKTFDVAMIGSLSNEKPEFQHRRNLCQWLENGKYNRNGVETGIRVSVCGYGQQCPALAKTKLGFHMAGDTYSSQRLMDTILSGGVPVFTHLEQYPIAGAEWIDWSQLSYYIPVHNDTHLTSAPDYVGKFKRPEFFGNSTTHPAGRYSILPPASESSVLDRLDRILSDEKGYEERYQKILQHMALFDYTTLHPFDTYMYLFQAELYPETRHRPEVYSCQWSALKLPRPLFDDSG